jgi:hypothetical protein
MIAKFNLIGLEALRAGLKRLPDELKTEAAVIVHAQAQAMAMEVQARYPTGPTGNLKSGVRVDLYGDAVSVSARVRSTAAHAYLYETGGKGQERHYTGQGRVKTRKNPVGWKVGKSTGVMPAKPTFVPIAILRRRVMVAALWDLLERAGLTVTTSAAA